MRRFRLFAAVRVALLTVAQSAAASTARQTRGCAERNLLGATRMLARWHVGLTDPRTGFAFAITPRRTAASKRAGWHEARSVPGRRQNVTPCAF
jgi:hypothetical protein